MFESFSACLFNPAVISISLLRHGVALTESLNLLIDKPSCNLNRVTRCSGSFAELTNDFMIWFNTKLLTALLWQGNYNPIPSREKVKLS